MDKVRMRWVECPLLARDGTVLRPPTCSDDEDDDDDDNVVDILNRREGHCAAVLAVSTHATPPLPPPPSSAWVVVCGGYSKGSVSAVPLVAPTSLLPSLQWRKLPAVDEFECDGASLTTLDAAAVPDAALVAHTTGACSHPGNSSVAYLFGGFNGDMELRNTLYAVRLCGEESGTDASTPVMVSVTEVPTTGDVPAPRARHGAGGVDNRLFIFGGETASHEQTNDLHVCDVRTGVWRVLTAPPTCPAPRLLSLSLVFVSATTFVLYGGSHFVDGAVQSFADVWWFDVSTERWTPAATASDTGCETAALPRSNGHAGGAVVVLAGAAHPCTCAVFVGGKDTSEGDDRVKMIGFSLPGTTAAAVCVRSALPAVDTNSFPHWRYTPAVVATERGLLLLAGQCRHPQIPSSFLLAFGSKE